MIFVCVLLSLVLVACGSKNIHNTGRQSGGGNSEAENQASQNQNETSGGKVLIAYFSATGNTKAAAEYIAAVTGGDLFALVPVEPYSEDDLDWTDENSRVVYEHNHPDERTVSLVTAAVDHFDEYDTVFIGYPIWWGIAAWPVNEFISANNFTGKKVIPFCTSASSGLGESGALLKEAAQTGDWLEGKRFSSGVSETEIKEWLESLSY